MIHFSYQSVKKKVNRSSIKGGLRNGFRENFDSDGDPL